jgi:nuclear receptor interaction protein
MRRTENGHITACKISDANPNEMIASWSGDHIYSFDLVRSPDAKEQDLMGESVSVSGRGKGKVRESGDRKRKRKKDNSTTSMEAATRSSKPRHAKGRPEEEGDLALRVRYENGQTEDIAMGNAVPHLPLSMVEDTRESILNESQRRSLQIAKCLVKIRRLMFSLEATMPYLSDILSSDLSHHTASFTATLGTAATCVPEMDDITRAWRYPIDPLTEDIVFQQTLRGNRNSSRRFVQAAGTLARMLGGKIQTASRTPSPALDLFREITPSPDEGSQPPKGEIFCYDFLRAIILWLEGGPQALLQGFKRPPSQRLDSPRFPVPDDAQLSAINECIIPYLLRLARAKAIPNVDASRFVRDEFRQIFESESAAVIAFGSAVKMPLEDMTRALEAVSENTDNETRPYIQDRKTAIKYWGFKVGRGLLMNAGEGINFQYVDIAFGGLGTSQVEEGRVQEEVDPNEDEDIAENVSLVKQRNSTIEESTTDEARSPSAQPDGSDIDIEDAGSDAEVILMDDLHNEIADHMAAEDEDEDNDYDNANDDADSDADDDDDGEITAEERQFMFQSASDRGKLREKVEKDVPCDSHTRKYTGHCNVKTVKDANFFGLQDEYVVSGSDGGHLFIWDKKTTELVNILEGDNEVVNVVQGKIILHLLEVTI